MLKPITIESVSRICALVIGPSGIGKTSLIWTLFGYRWDGGWVPPERPVQWPCCVVSAEAGLLSVRKLVADGLVEGYEVGSLDDFRDVYDHLCGRHGRERYAGGWIFVDSLTEISDRCNKHFKEKYPQKEKSFDRWDDYQMLMTTLIKGFRDATAFNVVFTALPLVDKDEHNRRFIGPNVTGNNLRQLLTSFFDEVFYYTNIPGDDGTEYRTFITGPYERYPGKDRSGRLNLFEPPDLLHIHRKILGDNPEPAALGAADPRWIKEEDHGDA